MTIPGDKEPQPVRVLLDGEDQEASVHFDGMADGLREWRGAEVRIVERLKFFEATFVTSGLPAEGVKLAWRVNVGKQDDTAAGVLTVRPNDKKITGEKGFTLTRET